jgi:ABC-2 type transport system permease protein
MAVELNAILAIAYRDLLKFARDRTRIVGTLVFPFIFIAALGGSMQASFGASLGYDFVTFTLIGVFAQSLFQSAALGIISLIEDRQADFSQEIFVSPISRYSIVMGKVVGESLVALAQGIAILGFGAVLGVRFTAVELLGLAIVAVAICLYAGAFGVVILGNISSQRAAQQIFPFVMLPQFFLAGVFNPIDRLPWYLDALSRISPLRYAVDLARGAYYADRPEYSKIVLAAPGFNLAIIAVLFAVFLVVGTWMFVRNERNR